MLKWFSSIFNRPRETTTKTANRKEFIEKLILNHQRRLQKLKERQASSHHVRYVPPQVEMEIEDLEVEVQQLKTALADEDEKNQEKLEQALAGREQRLQVLRKIEDREGGSYEQEIEEIEAKIQGLQSELDQL